jgi:hypothetical protein
MYVCMYVCICGEREREKEEERERVKGFEGLWMTYIPQDLYPHASSTLYFLTLTTSTPSIPQPLQPLTLAFYKPLFRRVDDTQFNFALDLHLVTRGLWRGIYVACFLIGVVDKGRGLEGSFADNLPHLAGVLQIMINFDLFSGEG